MPECPPDDDLTAFLNDALAAGRQAAVSGHIDRCPECQGRLDRLLDRSVGAVARFKGRPPDGPDAVTQLIGAEPLLSGTGAPPRVPGFDVLGEIGRGGMGVVYKARHRRLNRLVALKMILAGTAADPRLVQRFLFEGEVLARVHHPQVVTVFEVDTFDGPDRVPVPYLAMELLEGGSLSRLLRDIAAGAAPRLAPRAAAELVEGLARAVHAVHLQGVVHRDLKPGNILFAAGTGSGVGPPPGGPGSAPSAGRLAKVVDFGLAKFTQEGGADLTRSGQVVGTPQYMAPEQAQGGRAVGPEADVYALGAILYECLTGRPPFTGGEPMSLMLKVINDPPTDVRGLRPEVPRDLAAVTMKCLAKDPGRRYPSAEALADDLRRFGDDRPTKARPVTPAERLWFAARRNPAVASLTLALSLVLAFGFVAVGLLWVRAEGKAADEQRQKQAAEAANAHAQETAVAAEAANARARAELVERQRREAQLEFARAVAWCEDGRVTEGLHLFVGAVELAEATGDTALARVARTNLAAWARELPPPSTPLRVPPSNPQPTQPPLRAAYHPDGRHLLTAGRNREVLLWDLDARAPVRRYQPPFEFGQNLFKPQRRALTYWTVAVSPDGRLVAAGGGDGKLSVWETGLDRPATEVPLLASAEFPDPVDPNLWDMAFATDRVLWTNDGRTGLLRWDLSDPRRPRARAVRPAAAPPGALIQCMALSPDRARLYTGDRFGFVREWDADTGAEVRVWALGYWLNHIAVSPDGTRLAATGAAGAVALFDLTRPPPGGEGQPAPRPGGPPLQQFEPDGASGTGVAFAPKRPYLVATDADGRVRCWQHEVGQPVGPVGRFGGAVLKPVFRPNSDEYALAGVDAVHLCRLPDPAGDVLSAGRNARLRALDFSPDGTQLLAADDRGVRLFALAPEQRCGDLDTDAETLAVRFAPDRSRLYRGTRSGLRFVTLPGGTDRPLLPFKLDPVNQIEPLGDGTVLFVSGAVLGRCDPGRGELAAMREPIQALPRGVELGALAARPDGAQAFVAFGDRAAVVRTGDLETVREWRAGGEVMSARYTADGTRLLIGLRSGAAELRDARTFARLVPPMPHGRAVTAVAVSPGGAVFLTVSRDATGRFWDAATGHPLGPVLRHGQAVTHAAFAPNGEHAATGTYMGTVTFWDVPPPPLTGTVAELRARFPAAE